jgi:hypothetical protein
MKISKGILLEISESDLDAKGHFYNAEITSIANGCFYEMRNLKSVELPKVKKIGYNCFSYNAALTSVSLPVLAQCGYNCFSYNAALTSVRIGQHKLNVKNIDGYCYVIESHKTSKGIAIYSGYNLDKVNDGKIIKTQSFVAQKDEFTAHGETIQNAVRDLHFKINAEQIRNSPINADTKITMQHYRIITGACEQGCKSWMTQNNIPFDTEISAKELLPILQKTSAYGYKRFKELVTF